jgi:hypothetical protein
MRRQSAPVQDFVKVSRGTNQVSLSLIISSAKSSSVTNLLIARQSSPSSPLASIISIPHSAPSSPSPTNLYPLASIISIPHSSPSPAKHLPSCQSSLLASIITVPHSYLRASTIAIYSAIKDFLKNRSPCADHCILRQCTPCPKP